MSVKVKNVRTVLLMQAKTAILSRQRTYVGNGSDYSDGHIFANSSEMDNRDAYITLLYHVSREQWSQAVLRRTCSSSSLF